MRAIQAARRPVRTIPAGTPLTGAAEAMAGEGLRAIIVVDGEGVPVGIVTERDLVVRGLARGLHRSAPVERVMTPELVTADASTSTRTVYRLLRDRRIRQIPVTQQGRIVAVVERDDLTDEAATEVLARLRNCPRCRGNWLRPVETDASTNFLCLNCRSCWAVTGGEFAPVESRRCAGCEDHNLCRPPLLDHGLGVT
ncbi:MAG TPA: CBS domain-containing protein [Acidimicrobiia bacterium]|nr:CBS domain-containing protein [Acidimicrobiia bacterium]